MTINTTILNKIWKAQNLFKHETKKLPTKNIIPNIKNDLKEIIIHYKKHEQNNSLLVFQEKFAIENALCTIENGSINYDL